MANDRLEQEICLMYSHWALLKNEGKLIASARIQEEVKKP